MPTDPDSSLRMPQWRDLLETAQDEVRDTLEELPSPVRRAASAVPVIYERRPGKALVQDGLDDDLLGLFVGDPLGEEGQGSALPAQILLYLENLWEFVEGDPDAYCEEVRTTFLHELGHYLGLDEGDLEERGLE
jgi:predicted Zn-dependent protease with MMP-like domain